MNSNNQRTLAQIFRHPMTHNLTWRDAISLFEHLGQVEQEHNGNLRVTINSQLTVFHGVAASDVASPDQVNQMRSLLREHESHRERQSGRLLLVLNFHEGRIFDLADEDAEPISVVPLDPDGTKSHVHPTKHEDSGRNVQPNHDAYFEAVAVPLEGAKEVIVFGSGEGASGAMLQFLPWLEQAHPATHQVVSRSETVDQSHLSNGELRAKALVSQVS